MWCYQAGNTLSIYSKASPQNRHPTGAHAGPRTWQVCSCICPAPSASQPPPGAGPSSPSPGRTPGLRSGSPSAAGRRGSAWLPCCSSCAGPSTCRPAHESQGEGNKTLDFSRGRARGGARAPGTRASHLASPSLTVCACPSDTTARAPRLPSRCKDAPAPVTARPSFLSAWPDEVTPEAAGTPVAHLTP